MSSSRGKKIRRALATERASASNASMLFPRLQVLHIFRSRPWCGQFQGSLFAWLLQAAGCSSCLDARLGRGRRKRRSQSPQHLHPHLNHLENITLNASERLILLFGGLLFAALIPTLEMNIWGKMNWWSGSGQFWFLSGSQIPLCRVVTLG